MATEETVERPGNPALQVGSNSLDDEGIFELMAVVDLFAGLNKFNAGLDMEMDEKPWYG